MTRRRSFGRTLFPATLVVAGLCACLPVEKTSLPRPQTRPAPAATPTKAAAPSSPRSESARQYYASMQSALLAQGLMRTDGGGTDTPYSDHMLAENFLRIALYDEYDRKDGSFVRGETKSILRRWQAPVRFGLVFGEAVPADRRATDKARVASYVARLSKVSRHPMSLVETEPNFTIFVVTEDERAALGPALNRLLPGLSARDVADITDMARTTYCMVYAQSEGETGVYQRAVAVVRAEHPDLLRQSCFHEEIAQGLGLANDSPRARPSIFNDDEEFALLTLMDERMLEILYDPALRPGMRHAEAAPIVRRLATRVMGEEI